MRLLSWSVAVPTQRLQRTISLIHKYLHELVTYQRKHKHEAGDKRNLSAKNKTGTYEQLEWLFIGHGGYSTVNRGERKKEYSSQYGTAISPQTDKQLHGPVESKT